MKILIRLSLVASAISLFSCAPDTPSVSEYSNTSARYAKNVSELYGVVASSDPLGVDIKWLDSTGVVDKLSKYHGKPGVVVFGRIADAASDSLFREVDSIRAEMGDSVYTLIVTEDAGGFNTVSQSAVSQAIKTQIVCDASFNIELRFVGFADGFTYPQESFILDKSGKIVSGDVTAGREDKDVLKKYLRAQIK
jgi:hypothetical protein